MTLDAIPLAGYNISIPISATKALITGDERILHFTTMRKFILFIKSIFTGVYEPDVYHHVFHYLHEIEGNMDLCTEQWKPMNAFTRFIDLTPDSQRENFTINFTEHASLDDTVIATFKFKDIALCDILLSSDNAAQLIDIYASCGTDVTNKISLHEHAGNNLKNHNIFVNEFFVKNCYDMFVNITTSPNDVTDDPPSTDDTVNDSEKDSEGNKTHIQPILINANLISANTLTYLTIPPVA